MACWSSAAEPILLTPLWVERLAEIKMDDMSHWLSCRTGWVQSHVITCHHEILRQELVDYIRGSNVGSGDRKTEFLVAEQAARKSTAPHKRSSRVVAGGTKTAGRLKLGSIMMFQQVDKG